MRKLRIGEEVVGADGRRLGTLQRLVVDEQAHRVTHLVVEERLVGAGHVRDAAGGRLLTDLDRPGLLRQPEAHDEMLAAPGDHWQAPTGYVLADFFRVASALIGQAPYVPPVHLDLDVSGFQEIAPGSAVWSGRRRVGEVSEVRTDDEATVSALVLKRSGLFGKRLLLSPANVVEVVGSNVHVDLDEPGLEALPPA